MDPTSAVRTDTLPVIATVIGPGAFASSFYVWWGLSREPGLRAFLNEHEGIAAAAAIVVWIVTGFMLESVGSYVEVYAIDRRRRDHAKMIQDWWRYLRVAWTLEPIGQRYLRRMLVSFKFELNMSVAMAVSCPGIIMLARSGHMADRSAVVCVGLLAAGSILLFLAARGSAEVLADLRGQLLFGVGEPPFDEGGHPRDRSRA
jgi:hypothetical protein